jgi:hypothetical protein
MPKKATTKTEKSDIFIYRDESGGYATHPTPFVIHDDLETIRFRNLTNAQIKVEFKKPIVNPQTFSIGPGKKKKVTCQPGQAGVYEYKIGLATPPAAPGLQQLPKTYAQGHSSPKMIVDT